MFPKVISKETTYLGAEVISDVVVLDFWQLVFSLSGQTIANTKGWVVSEIPCHIIPALFSEKNRLPAGLD